HWKRNDFIGEKARCGYRRRNGETVMTIQMPEPIYEVGDYPSNGEVMCDCYSLEQLEAYADERVREALEEAATIIEKNALDCIPTTAVILLSQAQAIRAMIP